MGTSDAWDGTITLHDFNTAAIALLEIWKEVCPTLPSWRWIPCCRLPFGSSHRDDGYLALVNACYINSDEKSGAENEYPGGEGLVDDASLNENDRREALICEFHVVYSCSYNVPVLYFSGHWQDGRTLKLADFENILTAQSLRVPREAKWTFITQEEHPYLKQPWFMLHPCGTSEWMRLLFDEMPSRKELMNQQYLLSWLSVVGQVTGLRISPKMLRSAGFHPVTDTPLGGLPVV